MSWVPPYRRLGYVACHCATYPWQLEVRERAALKVLDDYGMQFLDAELFFRNAARECGTSLSCCPVLPCESPLQACLLLLQGCTSPNQWSLVCIALQGLDSVHTIPHVSGKLPETLAREPDLSITASEALSAC